LSTAYRAFFYVAVRYMKFTLENATVMAWDFVGMPIGMFITVTNALNRTTIKRVARNLLSRLNLFRLSEAV